MKNILIVLISLLFFSCNHDIPIANIDFVKIVKNENYKNYYFIHFTSDTELIDNLHKNHLGSQIDCFFKDKKIKKDDYANYKGYVLSSVGDLILTSKKTKYHYKIEAFLKSFEGEKFSNNPKREKEMILKEILDKFNEQPGCISCAVTAVTFMNTTKRYISNTMCLPKNELKKVMEK